jgi:hypothetical protein
MTILDEDGLCDELIDIANISKTRMDEWNIKSIQKGGPKYSSLCEVYVYVKEHTTHF